MPSGVVVRGQMPEKSTVPVRKPLMRLCMLMAEPVACVTSISLDSRLMVARSVVMRRAVPNRYSRSPLAAEQVRLPVSLVSGYAMGGSQGFAASADTRKVAVIVAWIECSSVIVASYVRTKQCDALAVYPLVGSTKRCR